MAAYKVSIWDTKGDKPEVRYCRSNYRKKCLLMQCDGAYKVTCTEISWDEYKRQMDAGKMDF